MGRTKAFSRLFEPVSIGKLTIKNRLVKAPTGTGYFTREGLVTEQAKAFYEARAKGGAGLVIVEIATVEFPRGIHATSRLVIDNDSTIAGLAELAGVIKKHGARAAIQLSHAGRQAKSRITGFQPVAISAVPCPAGANPQGETPRELTVEELGRIVELFGKAAVRARKAGFDGIEIHAAHDYMLAGSLSPLSNRRQDRYGGSLENRGRLLSEVLKAIEESVGADFPLWCRINGREFGVEGGLTLEDTRATARMLNNIVDAIHVSAWGYGDMPLANMPDTPGALLPLAEGIKEVVSVPVIAVGRMTPELAEKAIEEGKADMISFGRELIADPDIPNKIFSMSVEDIKPCIACFHCQDTGTIVNSPVVCAVNPAVGREVECEIKPAKPTKKIAVIGGGPAGMEAARVLALRGHRVTLYEKEPQLGGQMRFAMAPPYKRERIEPLIIYLQNQLEKLSVEVKLNTEASLEIIERECPDLTILATGAMPLIPPLPGADLRNVVTVVDVLSGRVKAGSKVVIIGGGSTGCETAEFLLEQRKQVTVVEMLQQLAADMGFRDRVRLLSRVNKLPIKFLIDARCTRIQEHGIAIIDREKKEQFIQADTVVLSVGVERNNSLFPLLKEKGIEVHLAGDCWQVGKIASAISDGFRLGSFL